MNSNFGVVTLRATDLKRLQELRAREDLRSMGAAVAWLLDRWG